MLRSVNISKKPRIAYEDPAFRGIQCLKVQDEIDRISLMASDELDRNALFILRASLLVERAREELSITMSSAIKRHVRISELVAYAGELSHDPVLKFASNSDHETLQLDIASRFKFALDLVRGLKAEIYKLSSKVRDGHDLSCPSSKPAKDLLVRIEFDTKRIIKAGLAIKHALESSPQAIAYQAIGYPASAEMPHLTTRLPSRAGIRHSRFSLRRAKSTSAARRLLP